VIVPAEASDSVLADYLRRAGEHDEFGRLADDPGFRSPVDAGVGGDDLRRRQRSLGRLVRAEAITYGGAPAGQLARPWLLDLLPLVIPGEEWRELEAGLRQRAELLDEVLSDVYGQRRLLSERVLPAELVLGHGGFLPVVDGIRMNAERQLVMTATDLVRGADGRWMALGDRAQAPSGAGYAMANRRLVARILEQDYRDAPIRRLRGFFDHMRLALQTCAPAGEDNPRVVLLSPGPASETAYDQALVSTLLGHPVAQSGDLEVLGGRLWLRTTGRREPVHVLQRRVDASWADSLDLRPESRLGVPGLVEAARQGRVGVANPLGSAVLENPGLLAYLDRIAVHVLGEPLRLASVPTWWCGDPEHLAHVLSHLDELVIKPVDRRAGRGGVRPVDLDEPDRQRLVARITAEPGRWAAQQSVEPSTSPVVGPTGLEARRTLLRTFAVSAGSTYAILPGGLARVAPDEESWVITNRDGAISKDVWVLEAADETVRPLDLSPRRRGEGEVPTSRPGLTPSAADQLYWLGRYSERTEATARMLKVSDKLIEDNLHRPGTPGHSAMRAMLESLTAVTSVRPGFTGEGAVQRLADPLPQVRSLLLDEWVPGTVAYGAGRTTAAAADVREVISADIFSVLNALDATLSAARAGADVHVQHVIADVLRSTLALAGIVGESLVREPTWTFVESGRRIERAQTTVRMLRHTLAGVRAPVAEALLVESVLEVGDSLITYARRMAAGVGASSPAEAAASLLLLDPDNPRSVRYQIDRLIDALRFTPAPGVDSLAAQVRDLLVDADMDVLRADERAPLRRLLDELDEQLRLLSDQIEQEHFQIQQPAVWFAVQENTGGRR